MTAVDNTCTVLFRYLRELSLKISRCTVHRLLDTPVGNSMRGISDALDALHIINSVYQLPSSAEYFTQIDVPFITMLHENETPFCVVKKKDDSFVEFINSEDNRLQVRTDVFLKKWTGVVLLGETTENTPIDKLFFWKNILYRLWRYKGLFAILIAMALGFAAISQNQMTFILIAYMSMLCIGILASVAIIYKEQINKNFLERFCHIGKRVDCNEVLHSKGGSILGMSLGELSLFYFTASYMFCALCPEHFYTIAVLSCLVAIGFTIYSVLYQSFVIHKGCMLCMLVNIIIWISGFILVQNIHSFNFCFFLPALFTLLAVVCVCLIAGISIKSLYKDRYEKESLQQRFTFLLNTDVFQRLLPLEPHIKSPVPANIALHNREDSENHLMVVTNPNCGVCAKIHRQVKELSETVPLSMVLLTFPNDKVGERVAQTVIAAYLSDGWQKSMSVLEEWYNKRRIREADRYTITPEAKRIWKEQQEYCLLNGITKTPVAVAAGRYIPKPYKFSDLRYVLT